MMEPDLKSMQGDPRFVNLVRRVGLVTGSGAKWQALKAEHFHALQADKAQSKVEPGWPTTPLRAKLYWVFFLDRRHQRGRGRGYCADSAVYKIDVGENHRRKNS